MLRWGPVPMQYQWDRPPINRRAAGRDVPSTPPRSVCTSGPCTAGLCGWRMRAAHPEAPKTPPPHLPTFARALVPQRSPLKREGRRRARTHAAHRPFCRRRHSTRGSGVAGASHHKDDHNDDVPFVWSSDRPCYHRGQL